MPFWRRKKDEFVSLGLNTPEAMLANVRASDTVARLGGDEFALMLPSCNEERAVAVAEKVRAAIRNLAVPWEGKSLQVGASLGVAALSDGHRDIDQWLAEADAACYDAKHGGRDAVRVAATAKQA